MIRSAVGKSGSVIYTAGGKAAGMPCLIVKRYPKKVKYLLLKAPAISTVLSEAPDLI